MSSTASWSTLNLSAMSLSLSGRLEPDRYESRIMWNRITRSQEEVIVLSYYYTHWRNISHEHVFKISTCHVLDAVLLIAKVLPGTAYKKHMSVRDSEILRFKHQPNCPSNVAWLFPSSWGYKVFSVSMKMTFPPE